MKLPEKLTVFGMDFRVCDSHEDSEGYSGYCCFETNTIYVNPEQPVREQMVTLLHELGHAVFKRCSINQVVDENIEEIIVDNMAIAICENFQIKILER